MISSAEYKTEPRSSARRARRRARTTGSRRATGTTRRTTTRPIPRTNVGGAWGSTARRARATPCRRSTRSSGSCRRSSRSRCGRTPTTTSTTPTTSPATQPDNGGYSFGTLHDLDAAITSRYGAVVEPRPVRRGGPGPELRDPAREFEAYIDHSTNAAAPSTGIDLLAAQQGLADAAVGPLQQRLRPGRQLLRGQEGQRAAARPLRLRQRHGVASTTWPARRQSGPVGRVEGLRRRRHSCSTTRPPARHLARRPGVARTACCTPSCPPPRRRRRRRRPTSSSCCCSRNGTVVDRNVYWLSTQQDIVNWDADHRQPAGDDDAVREPHGSCSPCRRATVA